MALIFISTTLTPIKRVFRKYNNCLISFLMFYDNRKNMIFKVLSSVVYFVMDNYICAGYLCFPYKNLMFIFEIKYLKHTTYNAFSVIVIAELLMNVISCHGFVKHKKSDVIFSCCSKLVSYYLSKRFFSS